MVQLTLFGGPRRDKRRTGHAVPGVADTSREAARSIEGAEARKQESRVLGELLRRGDEGATRQELAAALGLEVCSICARIDALKKRNAVYECGIRRRTESGRSARVVFAVMEEG